MWAPDHCAGMGLCVCVSVCGSHEPTRMQRKSMSSDNGNSAHPLSTFKLCGCINVEKLPRIFSTKRNSRELPTLDNQYTTTIPHTATLSGNFLTLSGRNKPLTAQKELWSDTDPCNTLVLAGWCRTAVHQRRGTGAPS